MLFLLFSQCLCLILLLLLYLKLLRQPVTICYYKVCWALVARCWSLSSPSYDPDVPQLFLFLAMLHPQLICTFFSSARGSTSSCLTLGSPVCFFVLQNKSAIPFDVLATYSTKTTFLSPCPLLCSVETKASTLFYLYMVLIMGDFKWTENLNVSWTLSPLFVFFSLVYLFTHVPAPDSSTASITSISLILYTFL